MGARAYLDLFLGDYRITALMLGSLWLVISFALYLIKVKLDEQKENQSEQESAAAPLAPYRALTAITATPEAASAGLALSRWRGQLANSTGWNEGMAKPAVGPQEPALPGRDLPNPEVDTRTIKRAAETNRPLLVGPAEEANKVETEIRDRLGKLQLLHAART